MAHFTAHDLDSLGHKLDALDLSDGERTAFDAVFDAAVPDADVEGFLGFPHEHQNPFSVRLRSVLLFDEADALFGKRS